jgi:predicted negative regulator of RcsB-dependent stress response
VDDLLSEKEQIDQMRSWWSEYGGYVIFGIAAGALLLFGINYYQNSKLEGQLEASALYESLTNHVVDGNLDQAEVVAGELGTTFADTTYAAQAKLAIARLYMDKNRDQDAADALDALLQGSASEQLKQLARLRLARVLLYQDKPQEVVDLLEGQDAPGFAASYGEVLGDAYHALGRIAEAEAAYQAVLLDPLSQGTIDQQLVQWKSLDLPQIPSDDASLQEPSDAPVDEPLVDEVPVDDIPVEADGTDEEVTE